MKSPGDIKEKATRFSIYSPLVQRGSWVLPPGYSSQGLQQQGDSPVTHARQDQRLKPSCFSEYLCDV